MNNTYSEMIFFIFSPLLIGIFIIHFVSGNLYQDTGELELVSEMTGDDLIPLIEETEIYTKKEFVDGKSIYTFKYEDKNGEIQEMTIHNYSNKGIIVRPDNEVNYFESNSDEPRIKLEEKVITHPWDDTKFYKATIIMPK